MGANVPRARLSAAVIETLEERRLLTALPGAANDVPPIVLADGTVVQFNGDVEFKDGILTVNGQGRRNEITFGVFQTPGGLVVHFEQYVRDGAGFYGTRNVGFANIPASDLKGIVVFGSDEDDSIYVDPTRDDNGPIAFDIPMTVFGGAGDDTIIGGQAPDDLVGGAGHDWIEGGASLWLDREWFNGGWRGTDTMHVDLPRFFVGDDTIGGGVAGEVIDGESDGNDMPAPDPVAAQEREPLAAVTPVAGEPHAQPEVPATSQPPAIPFAQVPTDHAHDHDTALWDSPRK
jgi:hypothetical protein